MKGIFWFPESTRNHALVESWFGKQSNELATIARCWFETLRQCGDDVTETLHDGHPTACVEHAAFAYVDAFTSHVNLGFFRGAELEDAHRLLQGAGKSMRHVKLRPGVEVDASALEAVIQAAYLDMRARLESEKGGALVGRPALRR